MPSSGEQKKLEEECKRVTRQAAKEESANMPNDQTNDLAALVKLLTLKFSDPAYDKRCPIFIKETELQAIKVTYKVDNAAAKQIYNERHKHSPTTYSTIVTDNTSKPQNINKSNDQSPTTTVTHFSQNPSTSTKTNQIVSEPNRKLVNYEELPPIVDSPNECPLEPKVKKVKVYPKNLPKRLQAQLKRLNASSSNNKAKVDLNTINDSDEMDCNEDDPN